ncbi:hypothetical protein CDAR_434031 [Caerostris darwini]|uniref:Uncharacterized protein n=1 Tax=Caerostris darwini TaxID=1538125 RepID=A0AAV4S5C9_9ARAC|nr:hypothetical protein CDAR_434031 [Caerostris darwini]
MKQTTESQSTAFFYSPLFPESDGSIFINATEGQTRVETDRDLGTESVLSLIARTPPNVQRWYLISLGKIGDCVDQ